MEEGRSRSSSYQFADRAQGLSSIAAAAVPPSPHSYYIHLLFDYCASSDIATRGTVLVSGWLGSTVRWDGVAMRITMIKPLFLLLLRQPTIVFGDKIVSPKLCARKWNGKANSMAGVKGSWVVSHELVIHFN